MGELPTGTVTFLFTDIEGSTRLLQTLGPEAYRCAQDRQAEILRRAITGGGGTEVRTEGDAFFAVFPTATGALAAAVAAQRELAAASWPLGFPLRVRMGLHTGEGRHGGDDYLGIDVNRAARIAAAGHGGQVLVSDTTRGLVEHDLPEGVALRDLGRHRLKDIEHPEHLNDLTIGGLPADFPPLRSLRWLRTNLPAQRSSFVGRERELAELRELLTRARLLTLTGAGGAGKTRLALRVAADQLDRFDDGVLLVDLSTVTDPAVVPSTIASAVGVRKDPTEDLLDTLARHLADRELLLVVDNLEQVLDAAPALGRLLDAASRLSILATSRVPLHLSGEQEYPVEPLSLPDPGGDRDLDALMLCESVLLFVERARAVAPRFLLDGDNAAEIAEIVRRVDGLPLAIELAAGHVKLLSPQALLRRLERRLPLLTGGPRDAPSRQQTLRATIQWSHTLLDAEQQRLFARLAVFRGGCTLGFAEAVCAPGLGVPVLEGLGSLLDKSLLRQEEAPDRETRFRMLETVLEYAAERLAASGELEELRRRHAEQVRDLAEQAEPQLMGADQVTWMERLEAEHDNVRASLDWAEEGGDVATALRTAAAFWRFWLDRAHLTEARARLERLVALPGAEARTSMRARALGALGGIAYWQHDYEAARGLYEEAVDIARATGEPSSLARALFDLSFVLMVTGRDLDGAERLLDEALAQAPNDDRILRAQIWRGLGYLRQRRGDPAGGIAPHEHALALHREAGDRDAAAEDLGNLAGLRLLIGDPEPAWELLREALSLLAELGSRLRHGTMPARRSRQLDMALLCRAVLASHDGDHLRAARLLGVWARGRDEGGGIPPSFAYAAFGDLEATVRAALGEGVYERARAEGYAMSVDQAWVSALADEASPAP